MEDVAEQIPNEQRFSIEFEDKNAFRIMSAQFWKNNELCRVFICRSAFPSADLAGKLGSLARLFSVTSTQTDIVACSGCPVCLIQALIYSSYLTRGIQMCSRLDSLELSILMHKPSYSMFGIDFFSVLRELLVSLGCSLSKTWFIKSPCLTRVS